MLNLKNLKIIFKGQNDYQLINVLYDIKELADNNNLETYIMVEIGGEKRVYSTEDYRCLSHNTNRLHKNLIAKYEILLPTIEREIDMKLSNDINYKAYKNKFNKSNNKNDGAGSSLGTRLEELMLQVLAKETAENMKKEILPYLQDFIKDNYGMLPKQFEVKTPTGETKKVKGVAHEKFETVLQLVNADIPVFLTGPAGSGKNHLCKMVADSLGYEFYFTNAVTSEYKLTGFIDANGTYHETEFYKAFVNGGLFMLDEMDASIPEVLIILNAAIANRYFDFPNGKVQAHENFRVISAGNTVGTGADNTYTGRLQLDGSSLDRFALVEIDYSREVELAIARGNNELVDFIHDFRDSLKDCGFDHLVSYRAIERITKLEGVLETGEVIKMCLLKHMSYDDTKILINSMNKRSNKYFKIMSGLVA